MWVALGGRLSGSALLVTRLTSRSRRETDRACTPRGIGDRLTPVERNPGRIIIGLVLLLGMTAGFEFELAWLFLGALVLFFAWLGYLLLGPET